MKITIVGDKKEILNIIDVIIENTDEVIIKKQKKRYKKDIRKKTGVELILTVCLVSMTFLYLVACYSSLVLP